MRTILETVTRKVSELGHGESFWIGDNDLDTHVRLSSRDKHINHQPGKAYSVCRGVIHEHDADELVSYLKIIKE